MELKPCPFCGDVFKEPMRKEFRRLDEYVTSLESEIAELRELVRVMRHFIKCLGVDYGEE